VPTTQCHPAHRPLRDRSRELRLDSLSGAALTCLIPALVAATLLVAHAGEVETPQVVDAVVSVDGGLRVLVISLDSPARFSAFRVTDPERAVVDVMSAGIDEDIATKMAERSEGALRVEQLELEPPVLRITAPLAAGVPLRALSASPSSEIRVALGPASPRDLPDLGPGPPGPPAPGMARPRAFGAARQGIAGPAAAHVTTDTWALPPPPSPFGLTGVAVVRSPGRGADVRLLTTRPVRYETFVLNDPARVVLELLDTSCAVPDGQFAWGWIPPEPELVERIRIIPDSGRNRTTVIVDLPLLLPFRATRPETGQSGVTLRILHMAPHDGWVVVDPGHGGAETGCKSPTGVAEKDINLRVALRVQEALAMQDIACLVTRADDLDVGLYDRAYFANECEADIFVSIHCNAFRGVSVGTEVYHTHDGSRRLAVLLQRELTAALARADRGVHTARFVVTRESEMPSALCELAFLDNEEEAALLTDPVFQEQAALAISRAIAVYLREGGVGTDQL